MTYGMDPDEMQRIYDEAMTPKAIFGRVVMGAVIVLFLVIIGAAMALG